MNEKIEKIKEHVKEHKEAYIAGAAGLVTGVLIAGITHVIMRRQFAVARGVADEGSIVNDLSNAFSFFNNQNVVNVIEREGRGHPGYITRCKETDQMFSSQTNAAKAFDIPVTVMSDHIRGKFDTAGGYHFEHVLFE